MRVVDSKPQLICFKCTSNFALEATGPTVSASDSNCEATLLYKWLYNFPQQVDYINLLLESSPSPSLLLSMLLFLPHKDQS